MTALIHTTRQCFGFCGNGLPIVVVHCCWLCYGTEYDMCFSFLFESETKLEDEMVKQMSG